MSSWPPARVERRVRAAVDDTVSGDAADAGDEFQMQLAGSEWSLVNNYESNMNCEASKKNGSKLLCIPVLGDFVALRCNVFFYFFMDVSHETIGFDTTVGQVLSKNTSKTDGFA